MPRRAPIRRGRRPGRHLFAQLPRSSPRATCWSSTPHACVTRGCSAPGRRARRPRCCSFIRRRTTAGSRSASREARCSRASASRSPTTSPSRRSRCWTTATAASGSSAPRRRRRSAASAGSRSRPTSRATRPRPTSSATRPCTRGPRAASPRRRRDSTSPPSCSTPSRPRASWSRASTAGGARHLQAGRGRRPGRARDASRALRDLRAAGAALIELVARAGRPHLGGGDHRGPRARERGRPGRPRARGRGRDAAS